MDVDVDEVEVYVENTCCLYSTVALVHFECTLPTSGANVAVNLYLDISGMGSSPLNMKSSCYCVFVSSDTNTGITLCLWKEQATG